MSAYEDIMSLYVEREELTGQLETLKEKNRNEVLDVCDQKLKPNKYTVERLDQAWIKKIRDQLYEQMELKVKAECQLRAWDLNDVMEKFVKKTTGIWDWYDKERVVAKKQLEQYQTNLLAYAFRVGQYPEIVYEMRNHVRRVVDIDTEFTRHFERVEKERVENESVLFERVMKGEGFSEWMDGMVCDYKTQCLERIKRS